MGEYEIFFVHTFYNKSKTTDEILAFTPTRQTLVSITVTAPFYHAEAISLDTKMCPHFYLNIALILSLPISDREVEAD